MKLYIRQKVFSFGAKFNVTDEFEEEHYKVEGEVFTLAPKLHLYDTTGNEVALVQKKLLSLMPKFYVYVNGLQIAEIVKEITFLKPRYYIIGKGWTVEGDLLAHDYSIVSNGDEIARIHKVWMSWGDSYELDIYDTEDEVGLIAVILAIDAIMDSGNSRAGYSST